MTIRSSPPGALVFIDEQEIGFTPVSTPFIYYGTREIRLIKDGFETLTVKQNFPPPWYQIPPLDFASENLWPHELRDERILDFQLIPQQIVPTEQLLERAENLRGGAQQGSVVPLMRPPSAAGLPSATAAPFTGGSVDPPGRATFGFAPEPGSVPLPIFVPPQAEFRSGP